MPAGTIVTADPKQLTELFRTARARVASKLPETMGRVAEHLVAAVSDEFDSAGRGNWPPLADSTIAHRRGTEAQILVDTGRFAGSVGRLLYLAGDDRAGDLAGELSAHGIAVDTVVIYRAVAAESLPADLVQALANARLDGALHYSGRSVTTLIELSRSAGVLDAVLNLAHYCLSEEIAVPLRKAGAERISVAPRPLEAALIGLL